MAGSAVVAGWASHNFTIHERDPMAELEQVLKELTYKEDGLEVGKRVFYTLTHETELASRDITATRTAKLLSLLVNRLVEEKRLSVAELDELLFNVAR